MGKIVHKENLSENVFKLEIEAPIIARKRKAGHFVLIKIGDQGERIPLTISSANEQKGTISLVVQKVGVTSHKLAALKAGEEVTDVVGPLGQPTEIEHKGTVLCAGGGVGIAPLLPIVEAMKAKGNKVISVIAGRTKELVILENEIRAHSDELVIMTDDGSYGQKGLITAGMEEIIRNHTIDMAVTIGPAVMMKFTSLLTKKYNIPTIASLNTIMVDGTGMCGACRVTVGGMTKFVCVDGPEFHAHEVDYDELLTRLNAYNDAEQSALENFVKETDV
ncbi:MAG: sulfide/dihydroorotate dehydrogenase-like FAD/NAD-binding protein [Bacteroidetes bacterium]|nr:sulfide/dihydroorotate dehydrogenase-like FAD/NAD-binding protein [Bacteroidota bacterium]